MSGWALRRAAAYGAAEGKTIGGTWYVRMLADPSAAGRPPQPNTAAEDWLTPEGYATMPRGVLSRCIESDAETAEQREAFASTPPAAIAAAFDRAFLAAAIEAGGTARVTAVKPAEGGQGVPRFRVTLTRITYAYATQDVDAQSADEAERRVSEALIAGELDLRWLHDDNEERVILAEAVEPEAGEGP